MAQSEMKTYFDRSPRIAGLVDRDATFVRLAQGAEGEATRAPQRGAQLADISQTGMRLISRVPLKTNVGDFVTVEFTLSGSDRTIKRQARVVRKISEFVFAVRFIGQDGAIANDLKQAIEEHVEARRRLKAPSLATRAAAWAASHRQGLVASFAGLLVIGGVATYIFVNSDEHQGKTLRSWGQELPKQWYWDYVNHFPKD